MADEKAAQHDSATPHAVDAHGAEHGHDAGHAHNPFEKSHLIGHVKDAEYFEFPRALGGKIYIPQLFKTDKPLATVHTGFAPIDDRIEPFDLKITKFMVLELIAAVIVIVLFTRLAARIKRGNAPEGEPDQFAGVDGRVHSR